MENIDWLYANTTYTMIDPSNIIHETVSFVVVKINKTKIK